MSRFDLLRSPADIGWILMASRALRPGKGSKMEKIE